MPDISLSNEQYKELLKSVFIGNYVRESLENDENTLNELSDLENMLLSYAKNSEASEFVQENESGISPSENLSYSLDETIEQFAEDEFWELLVRKMSEVEIAKTADTQEIQALNTNDEIPETFKKIYKKWESEFSDYGLERLEITEQNQQQ